MSTRAESRNTGSYRKTEQRHSFTYDRGIVQLPVASRSAASRLIRLHGGMGQRTVDYDFTRAGKPPIIPQMADTSGDTFLGGTVAPATPSPSSTGRGLDWSIKGTYVFAQDTPRIVGQTPIPTGSPPFIDIGVQAEAQASIPQGVAQQYVIGRVVDPAAAYALFVESVAAGTRITADGDYSWPFYALATTFTSDHIIQD